MRKFPLQSTKFLLLFTLLIAIGSCTTYVTPKKVERKITVGEWKIKSFIFNGSDIASQFSGETVSFGDNGSVNFLPAIGESGTCTTSSSRKPTLMYINGFVTEPYFSFNDDWEVTECGKFTVILQSESGSNTNSVTLVKVE